VHHHVGWGVPVPLPGGPGATEALQQLAVDKDSVVAAFTCTNGGRAEVGALCFKTHVLSAGFVDVLTAYSRFFFFCGHCVLSCPFFFSLIAVETIATHLHVLLAGHRETSAGCCG